MGKCTKKESRTPSQKTAQLNRCRFFTPPGPMDQNAACSNMAPATSLPREAVEEAWQEPYFGLPTNYPTPQPVPANRDLPAGVSAEKISSLVLFDGGLVEVGDLFRSLPNRADLKEENSRKHPEGQPGLCTFLFKYIVLS